MAIYQSNSQVYDIGVTPEINFDRPYSMVWVKGAAGQSGSISVDVAPPIATGGLTGSPNYGLATTLDLTGNWERVSPDFPVQYIKFAGSGFVHVVIYEATKTTTR